VEILLREDGGETVAPFDPSTGPGGSPAPR
jgi:hypothetical protein